MNLFHRIDDAQAIVRAKGGVFKQAELYRRADRIYVKHGGGFVRVLEPFNGSWGTSSPHISVIEMPDDVGCLSVPQKAHPAWVGPR
jgi:hypothetical protein